MDPFTLSPFDTLDGYTELGAGSSVDDSVMSAFCFSPNSEEQAEADASISDGDDSSDMSGSVDLPKSIHDAAITLPERMLKALAILQESSNVFGAILVQVWMPVKHGECQVLTTSDQPFLLDQSLTGYREISRQFMFSAAGGPGQFPGLPGRVFMSGMPEWTSNVMYYHDSEYLRAEHAVRHEVRGSLAVPVFDFSGPLDSCCVVLEVVMTQEKDNFCSEIDDISKALQSVHLGTVKDWTYPQKLTRNQDSAFAEILDVMRAVCHAHMLPLALVWVPICSSINGNVSMEYGDQDIKLSLRKKELLCIQESACYVNDMRMHYFVCACAEHPLERGQGVVGNAIVSNSPFFSIDVRDYDICDYPLAHHARKFGLQAAIAIRLRSTYTGSDDYVLEYFLPPMCKGCDEQQRLLDCISETMHRVCKSLRTVSDSELMADTMVKPSKEKACGIGCSSSDISVNSGHKVSLEPCTTSQGENKYTSTEKNINMSVLQKYFSGSLKDAAKSLGDRLNSDEPERRTSSDIIQAYTTSYLSNNIKKDMPSTWNITVAISQGNDASGDVFLVLQKSKIGNGTKNHDKNFKEKLPSSSSMTEYTSDSMSSHGTFQKCLNSQAPANDSNTPVTVKANYKDDAVRFRLLPSMRYHHLLDEIARPLKISVGTFQLKYRDDEDEWVILGNDADLQECLDILETTRSHVLKVQVRDVPCAAACSGSNSILGT
nr:unnamed protein product [Digitaria exilis]